MPTTGLVVGDVGLAAVVVQALTNFLKLNVLDKIIDPNSALYDWVTRGMVFILTLLVNAGAYVAEGGTPSGAWAIIVAGLASTGISLGNFHFGAFVHQQRRINAVQGNVAGGVALNIPTTLNTAQSFKNPTTAPPIVVDKFPVSTALVNSTPVESQSTIAPVSSTIVDTANIVHETESK